MIFKESDNTFKKFNYSYDAYGRWQLVLVVKNKLPASSPPWIRSYGRSHAINIKTIDG